MSDCHYVDEINDLLNEKKQKNKADCANFCGLLRKAELYRTKIVNCKLSVAFVVVLSTCSILSKHFLFLRFFSEQMDSFKKATILQYKQGVCYLGNKT